MCKLFIFTTYVLRKQSFYLIVWYMSTFLWLFFYTNLARLLSVASIFHILILIFLLVFVFHGEQVINIGRPEIHSTSRFVSILFFRDPWNCIYARLCYLWLSGRFISYHIIKYFSICREWAVEYYLCAYIMAVFVFVRSHCMTA
jgi:hypothetical protein